MKVFKITVLFIILYIVLLSSQCKEDMDCRLTLVNNSSEVISFGIDCYYQLSSELWTGNCFDKEVSANSKEELCSNNTWEHVFSEYDTDSIKVYVISYDTAILYNMIEIIENRKYYKIHQLSYDDLDSLNWTITYP